MSPFPLSVARGALLAALLLAGACGAGDTDDQATGGPIGVMALGDSITAGPYYRIPLARLVAESACPIDFVGTFDGVGDDAVEGIEGLDLDHQGVGGITTAGVVEQLPDWLAVNQPDIALVYLGVNDLIEGVPSDDTVADTERIVEQLRAANPRVQVLLAQIMPAVNLETAVAALDAKLARLARRLDRPTSPVQVVDQAAGVVVADDLLDGVHPSDEQAEVMAGRWADPLAAAVGPDCRL